MPIESKRPENDPLRAGRGALVVLAGVVAAACTAPGFAQSLNIDFSDLAGVPSNELAAAGLPGEWNAVSEMSANDAVSLVGLDGAPTEAVLSSNVGWTKTLAVENENTTGDVERLLDDVAPAGSDILFHWRFEALELGQYEVLVYAWYPASSTSRTMVSIDPCHADARYIGGPWSGGFEEGVTHSRFVVEFTAGDIEFCTAGGELGSGGIINGIQLVKIPTGDPDQDGDVDLTDFSLFAWCIAQPFDSPAANGCDVFDFDHDQDLDLTDYGAFTAAFTGSND